MRKITVSATQTSFTWDKKDNLEKTEKLVREAAAKGAQIILLSELFETPYFCLQPNEDYFELAKPIEENTAVNHFQKIAKELEVVLPISFYERQGHARYNSIAVIDADGEILGVYRKTHIPDSPGYFEKFFFNPGDTGFKVWDTKYAKIGVGICWDQWFPETARSMALMGAEVLFFPTAIGSEPQDANLISKDHWQATQCGHAAANITPVVASNRFGRETTKDVFDRENEVGITFYGSSFISNEHGQKVEEAPQDEDAVLVHTFDLDDIEKTRTSWGLFRDRRPEYYQVITSSDGVHPNKF
ncbi:N-carbamoylputrescine amidase [Flammeovirga kamogawensis]|uniref:N-carbamoylputrescine amidase n=1 Tax=Flammeovirga kamogawensis TaxID=373891 RepID=A0ABX8H2U0_9BACT|nr:N-carbamoylputrescine amidase [Flammeovirga kamogawensis]MBB6460420.1 N-carbamoylputrescine amidase [Flammeovirga kamogawensis]QWG10225.1 N-carbamoylputrescine amidase [Flammeovirga kamogawensis]TRX64676.1 N-carbamoylputrescine amidase [Flammeovirga kamogawensis]